MAASKNRNKQGEKYEKERRQPSGPNRREWWQVIVVISREKNMRKKGVSSTSQIGADGGKQRPK